MQPLTALIFDSLYDKHRGVIIYIRLFDGEIKKNQTIYFLNNGSKAIVNEVGFFLPEMNETEVLSSGEVGYIVTGLKNLDQARVGDTISTVNDPSLALPGYK